MGVEHRSSKQKDEGICVSVPPGRCLLRPQWPRSCWLWRWPDISPVSVQTLWRTEEHCSVKSFWCCSCFSCSSCAPCSPRSCCPRCPCRPCCSRCPCCPPCPCCPYCPCCPSSPCCPCLPCPSCKGIC